MSKATISKLLDSCNLKEVNKYLKTVHYIDIAPKGKRKHPSKQQLKDKIHEMENVSGVLADLQRLDEVRKMEFDKDDNEEYDNSQKEDDVMEMLKAELALRGKTTNGNSYPLLVRRLLVCLRSESE